MPTLLDYFNNDFTLGVSLDSKKKFEFQRYNENNRVIGQGETEILERIHVHSQTSTRLPTYYIPFHENTFDIICEVMKLSGKPSFNTLHLDFTVSFSGDLNVGNDCTTYTSRMYFYIENPIKEDERKRLDAFCKSKGILLTLRTNEYVKIKMNIDRPKAFISHDTRDKDLIARNIATGLSSRLCPVWYDEYSLNIGDSLRESIEKGIKEAHKCILVLTPNYLTNSGWGKTEFNSIFTRELIKKEKVILPIWSGVTKEEIYEYSPSLADAFALTWPKCENENDVEYKREVERLISKLHTALTDQTS